MPHLLETTHFHSRMFSPHTVDLFYVHLPFCSFPRRDSKYNHVRIHTKSEGGKTKYFLTDQTLFDTIFELVDHYKQYPLRSPRFEQILSFPVPRQDSYERQPWFHDKLSSKAAEDMLKRVEDGWSFPGETVWSRCLQGLQSRSWIQEWQENVGHHFQVTITSSSNHVSLLASTFMQSITNVFISL